jgi:two-component sensor histidine kinase
MIPTRIRSLGLLGSALFFSLGSAGCTWTPSASAKAVGGVVDLRSWDFEKEGFVSLTGEWEFFPGLLLEGQEALGARNPVFRRVPDQWKGAAAALPGTQPQRGAGTGAGTYRLTLLLPKSRPGLGIKFTTTSTALALDANGERLAQAGLPSLYPSLAKSAYKPGVASLPDASDRVIIVARVSNYDYRVGGMWRSFVLGKASALERRRWGSVVGSLALAATLAGLSVAFSFFFRTSGAAKSFICFCAFSLITGLRAIVTGEYAIVELFPGLGFDALIRMEYFSVFALYPLVYLFYVFLFPGEIDGRVVKVVLFACLAFFGFLFMPLRVMTSSLTCYYALAFVAMAIMAVIQTRAILHKRPGALFLLVGSVVLAAAGLNEQLFASLVVNTANYFPYFMLFFIAMQACALASNYRHMQLSLQAALSEKDMLLREVHHRVKNSLQIMASIVSLQSHRTEDKAALAAYASIRDRIRAISLVHERLYSLESGDSVDVAEYTRELGRQIAGSFGMAGQELAIEAVKTMIPADLCIDMGLIMTELLTNAYKYAIASSAHGKIKLRIQKEGEGLLLEVSDDGPGFPEGVSMEGGQTLGFKLVSSLVKKRGAELSLGRGPGASVQIRFPLGKKQL